MKNKVITMVIVAAMMVSTAKSTFAATLGADGGTQSIPVTVDTTKTIANGGSLPNGINYNVTVPANFTLTTASTTLDSSTPFGGTSIVNVKGSLASVDNKLNVTVTSTTASDTAGKITLASGTNTISGNFYVKSAGAQAYTISSQEDLDTAVSSAGLNIPIVIQNVTGVTKITEYTGGLQVSFTKAN